MASEAGSDGAHPDSGHLQQAVLVILRFPPEGTAGELTAAEEKHVITELDAATEFLWVNSNQSLRVRFLRVKFESSLEAVEYTNYGSSGFAAMYSPALGQALVHRHVDVERYAGVIMIYRPTHAPGGLFNNTWIWINEQLPGPRRNPGFSSIPYEGSSLLSELVVHEYLHQLDHRFERESGNPEPSQRGFMNPDNKDAADGRALAQRLATVFSTPADYYRAMLKYYVAGGHDSVHAVNYRWLDGIRGVFSGATLKAAYDFGQPDDALVHGAGDNITATHPGSPATFWFRAAPGHTATFRTQTAFGRYLLRQVAFNYEIAPGDYSFEVPLAYYDNRGIAVDRRIDSGSYVLGRQKFRNNRAVIPVNLEVEDFQIVFQKANRLSDSAADDDWLLLGDIALDAVAAP